MSTITTAPPPMESPWPPYRLSVEQYEAMVESGIFTEHDRLQLINGMLVAKCQRARPDSRRRGNFPPGHHLHGLK
jgi:hypothetical protein